MAEFSKLNGYDVKDKVARQQIQTIDDNVTSLSNTAVFPYANSYGNSPKIVKYTSTNNVIQITQKTNSGYLLYELHNANGDSSDVSVGTNWDLIRIKKIQRCLHSYVCKNTYSSHEGTLTTLFDGDTTGINSAEQLLFANGFAKTIDGVVYGGSAMECYGLPTSATTTYTMNASLNNKANILFYVTPNSSTQLNIYVNGTLYETINLAQFATTNNSLYLHEIEVPYRSTYKTYDIKLENTDTKTAYVCCLNYIPLDKYNGEDYDSFKSVLTNEYYINSVGSSDYAIHDHDLNKFCGSFHGGETAISQKITMPYPLTNTYNIVYWKDNYCRQDISLLNDGTFYVTPYVVLEQTTNINNKGKMLSTFTFDMDQVMDMNFSFYEGNINADLFYTGLTCNSTVLDIVKNPDNKLLISDITYLSDNNGYVEFSSSTTKLSLCLLFSKFGKLNQTSLFKNGRVQKATQYNKFYYGAIDQPNDPVKVESLQFRKILVCKII